MLLLGLLLSIFATTNIAGYKAQASNSNINAVVNPVNGFLNPSGLALAQKHAYDDPNLIVYHCCSFSNPKVIKTCLVFDSNSPNATLIGVDFLIPAKDYASLPAREKPHWLHDTIQSAQNEHLVYPNLTPQQKQQLFNKIGDTYSKTIIFWDPKDKLPSYPPQIVLESMVNENLTSTSSGQEPPHIS
jgi:hypothetical protein